MRTKSLFRRGCGWVAMLAFCSLTVAAATAAEEKPADDSLSAKGRRADEFTAAYDKGDAKAVAAFWTEQGDYVDQEGHRANGRAAIEKVYEKAFAAQSGAKLELTINSARNVGNEMAIEDGVSEVSPADGGPPEVSSFSAVLIKKDGNWYFESVREYAAKPPTNSEHFEELQWVVGEWAGENDKGESGTASYTWAENQNFIVNSFATTLNGVPLVGGTQWISWDAVEKKIRSWSFYSAGGVGEGVWTQDGNKWTIQVSAKTAAGKLATATNVLTKIDNDHAVWQTIQLKVDGKSMPDSSPLKLKRTVTK